MFWRSTIRRIDLQVLVAADGCTDATASIVEGYADNGVELLRLPRQGKIHALDAAVHQATGEVLVFSDANTMCDPHALRALVRNFADPEVGGVAGHTGTDSRLAASRAAAANGSIGTTTPG